LVGNLLRVFLSAFSWAFRSYRERDISVAGKPIKGGRQRVSAPSAILLPHDPTSVGLARHRLGAELAGAGVMRAVVDDAVLIVSELLSNALRHARPLPSGNVRLSWRISADGYVEVSVIDGGAATEPRVSHTSLSALGGRGLGIVDRLSDQWGVRHDDGTTIVWAVLADGALVPVAKEGSESLDGATRTS
jgi:anti-sigma regulatory factor (Ser/Thr protein kinase)